MNTYKTTIERLLQPTGIKINGKAPADIQVHDERFYKRVLQEGSLGLGESYMDGWWDCVDLDELFARLLLSDLDKQAATDFRLGWQVLKAKLFNQQTKAKASKDVGSHYNIGNRLYEQMLDSHMMYTCGYWENATTLEEAQVNKLELICQKLKLRPGLRVLDIGCGWGGFAQYAAEHYQVHVTGVTISTEQAKLARERCKGFPVAIRLQDYRDIHEKFDRIVSIGMFEHVGYKNYTTYMDVVNRNLREDGISLLHTIGSNESSVSTDPWLGKYIFPNSLLPSITQIGAAMEGKFVLEDLHNFGLHYDHTLMAWFENFDSAWGVLKSDYDTRFYRMWSYYLKMCAGIFRARKANLWQIVLLKKRYPEEYKPVRELQAAPAALHAFS